jgi:hypothetical protein
VRVWLALAALVVLITSCDSNAVPGRSPGPSLAPVVSSPSPTPPSPKVISLSGRGSKVLSPIHLEASNYRVSWKATGGTDNFQVTLHGAPGADTLLVNEIPPNPSSGEAFLNAGGGDYVLEVKASTLVWTITFTPI